MEANLCCSDLTPESPFAAGAPLKIMCLKVIEEERRSSWPHLLPYEAYMTSHRFDPMEEIQPC